MPGIARVGDPIQGTHTAPEGGHPHSSPGTIQTGSPDVKVNGLGVARIGDTGQHTDGVFTITQGSSTVLVNGLGVARLGDQVQLDPGPGQISGASPDVEAN